MMIIMSGINLMVNSSAWQELTVWSGVATRDTTIIKGQAGYLFQILEGARPQLDGKALITKHNLLSWNSRIQG